MDQFKIVKLEKFYCDSPSKNNLYDENYES